MKKTALIFIAAVNVFLCSCKFGPYTWALTSENVEDRVHSIERLSAADLPSGTNGQSKYSFLIVTDMHIGAERYTHDDKSFFIWLENQFNKDDPSQRPQFIVNLGDTADSGRESQFKEYVRWTEKVKELARNGKDGITDFKIYSLLGNHDIYNDGLDFYLDNMYPHKYSYCFDFANDSTTPGFEFFFLDSANGSLGRHQLEDLEDKLGKNNKPKIILSHYPVYAGGVIVLELQDTLERAKILTITAENNSKLIMAGHAHRKHTYSYGDMYEEVIPSYANFNTVDLITVDETSGTCSTDIIEF